MSETADDTSRPLLHNSELARELAEEMGRPFDRLVEILSHANGGGSVVATDLPSREGTGTVYTPYYAFHVAISVDHDALHGDIETGFYRAPQVTAEVTYVEERAADGVVWEPDTAVPADMSPRDPSYPDEVPVDENALEAAMHRAFEHAEDVERRVRR